MCFLLTYMLLYGYYFENEKVTLETILSPVPFDPRTLLFIGTTIFFVIGILLLVSIQLGDSIKSKEKMRIFRFHNSFVFNCCYYRKLNNVFYDKLLYVS